MALLDLLRGPTPFRALWIWAEDAPQANAYVYFRKEFDLKAAPEKAELSIFACDRYFVMLNGHAVRRGPAVGTETTRFYDVADVAAHLKAGRNAIAVIAYNYGPGTRNRIFKGPGALIARLNINYRDATIAEVSTDTSWKTLVPPSRIAKTPKINDWDVGYCEIFDPSSEPTGWMMPGFDDSAWKHALLLPASTASAFGTLVARPLPDLAYTLATPAKCVLNDAAGGKIKGAASLAARKPSVAVFDASPGSSRPTAIYDFGRIMSGRIRLRFAAKQPGGHLTLSYGEGRDIRPMDAVLITGEEITWSSFGTRAFRYVGISVCGNPAPVRLLQLEAAEEAYPFGERPSVSGDKMMRAIIDTGTNTLVASSRDYFVDCPGREQALWLGDIRLETLAAYHTFGDRDLARHSIELFILMQGRDGTIPAVGPLSGDAFIPDYHVQWPTIAYEYYMHTGDVQAVQNWHVALSKAVSWMERELDRRSLIPHANRPGWWCFLDWANYLPREDYSGILNIFAHEGFMAASRLARVIGNESLATRWLNLATNTRLGIYDNLYDPAVGLFLDIPRQSGIASHSRQVNALAVTSGLVEAHDARKVMEQLLKHPEIPPIQTPYFAWHYVEALFKAGLTAAAVQFMNQYWGGMIERGADCYWEMFDPTSSAAASPFPLPGGNTSRCHGWGAAIVATLVRRIAGIEPAEPGYKSIVLRPALDASIPAFGAAVRLSCGKVKFAVQHGRAGTMTCSYAFPARMPVQIIAYDKQVRVLSINNKPVYSRAGPVVISAGVTIKHEGERLVVTTTAERLSVRAELLAH